MTSFLEYFSDCIRYRIAEKQVVSTEQLICILNRSPSTKLVSPSCLTALWAHPKHLRAWHRRLAYFVCACSMMCMCKGNGYPCNDGRIPRVVGKIMLFHSCPPIWRCLLQRMNISPRIQLRYEYISKTSQYFVHVPRKQHGYIGRE